MRISEIFYSVQGEGKRVGVPSVFVRQRMQSALHVVRYAVRKLETGGENWPIEKIVEHVAEHKCRDVVLTGGEPVIMPEIVQLCASLKAAGHCITIETAATVFEPMAMDLASLSPKLSNSTPRQREGGRFAEVHERLRLNIPVIQRFIDHAPDFQLKFVVSSHQDLAEIDQLLSSLRAWKPEDVMLMPEGIDAATLNSRAGWIVDICKQRGFRFCPRLHIALFGNKRGT